MKVVIVKATGLWACFLRRKYKIKKIKEIT